MLLQTFIIARNTLVESLRQPIFFVLIIASGLMQALNTSISAFSMGYTDTAEVHGDNKMLLDVGMATVFVMGMILAAFQATAVISREIEDKTILTIVSKPIARPTVVIGKYLGVSVAIMMATLIMVTFMMFGIRHEVMTRASDTVDMPVMIFTTSAVGIAVLVAAWTNFFYGWSFPQVAVVLMTPLVPLAYIITLLISKEWKFQPIGTDFKPQILLACASLGLAMLVLTSIAVAASTRLSQVMTLVICVGVFVMGLLSNHFLGKRAFLNDFAAIIETATPDRSEFEDFRAVGARYNLTLSNFPDEALTPGTPLYYGPSPQGVGMAVPKFEPYDGDPADERLLTAGDTPPGIMVKTIDRKSLTIENIGQRSLPVKRPPQQGDYIFTKPTRVNPLALTAWSVVPNMHFFWLLDAVSQNRTIPPSHVARIGVYSLMQIGAFLSLAVILFQRRDVG
ncbi:MAG: ABC transporter permease subunit [Phycisphaerales bacterium]|nr:ABC transporter permease subunit [Phycisphaerales bacterium]MCB9835421.1 ABC transporter permease subunit [Phycisphaera sp.]